MHGARPWASCGHGLFTLGHHVDRVQRFPGRRGQPLVYLFNNRNYNRTFFNAPQSVTSFIAAFLEPLITVLSLLGTMAYYDEPVMRASMALCLLVFALTFPGRNRFNDSRLEAGVDIVSSWVSMLLILWLCGYATNSLMFFDFTVMLSWAVITPVLQWVAVLVGKAILTHRSSQPNARRRAIVVGAGPLGGKVARALQSNLDQGTEFVSRDLDLWAYTRGVTLDFSRPGKPTDNAFIEAFNGRFRAECLNAHWFMSLEDARQKMEAWRRYYNEDRPHGAIGNKPPISLINPDGAASPPT